MEVSNAYSLQTIGNQVQKNKVQMKKLMQDAQKCRDVWHDSLTMPSGFLFITSQTVTSCNQSDD